jgi:restriction system protein
MYPELLFNLLKTEGSTLMATRKRRKQNFITRIVKTVLYIFVKSMSLLFSFSIYLLKLMWRLLSFSMNLLYRVTKQIIKSMLLLFSFSISLLYNTTKRLLTKNPSNQPLYTLDEIDEMDGYKFEEVMKHVYEQLGYSVYHTPYSCDQGADLILTSKRRTKIAVQVKRYSGKVSNSAVQEVVAAKGFYKCTKGIVVTNSYFTDSAKQLAEANFIDLVDRNELEKMIKVILN